MSNNKQNHIGEVNKMVSSVEWLQAIELERDLTLADWNKAKAMHKEEVERAWRNGDGIFDLTSDIFAEKYYNKMFGEKL